MFYSPDHYRLCVNLRSHLELGRGTLVQFSEPKIQGLKEEEKIIKWRTFQLLFAMKIKNQWKLINICYWLKRLVSVYNILIHNILSL